MTGAGKIAGQMGRRALMWLSAVFLVAGTGALLPLGATAASAASMHARGTLTVDTRGSDVGNCRSSHCKTLGYALTQAGPNDTILIRPGTYPESGNANVVPPGLTGLSIESLGSAASTIIDATNNTNGILIQASGVSITGLTVTNALHEGILAEPPPSSWPAGPTSPPVGISHVTVADNIVVHNDQAYDTTSTNPMFACPTSATDTDDCGEAIHLLAVSWSEVIGNRVSHNVGGILVSDGGLPTTPTGPPTSVGPAAHNLIAFNRSTDNKFDCGITLPGHDPRAVIVAGPPAGPPQPQSDLAGVYDNRVVDNVSNGNGAAGLLDATPYPGTGSYDNFFADNSASGNGNAGFVLHSHAPFQYVGGIVVTGNRFGPNNLAGDPDTGVMTPTGIMLLSLFVPTKIVVAGNKISSNVNGVAFNDLITQMGDNKFANVTNHYFLYTAP
jgi:hypothetical protein